VFISTIRRSYVLATDGSDEVTCLCLLSHRKYEFTSNEAI